MSVLTRKQDFTKKADIKKAVDSLMPIIDSIPNVTERTSYLYFVKKDLEDLSFYQKRIGALIEEAKTIFKNHGIRLEQDLGHYDRIDAVGAINYYRRKINDYRDNERLISIADQILKSLKDSQVPQDAFNTISEILASKYHPKEEDFDDETVFDISAMRNFKAMTSEEENEIKKAA